VDESLGSWKSIFPSSILASVVGLFAGAGAVSGKAVQLAADATPVTLTRAMTASQGFTVNIIDLLKFLFFHAPKVAKPLYFYWLQGLKP
jgi:hypothetical protein